MDKPPVAGMAWQEYAFIRMMEANPFPASMGRVCPAPCEDGCNRNEVDDFVGINGVEQYVGDWAIQNKLQAPKPPELSGKRIAVIGGGPGGLSAAYFLRQKGHAVTIFEAHDHLGGMMRFGIPGYRTPRDMLDAEIARITSMDGVEVRTGVRVGRDISMDDLDKNYDAVFWAIGAQKGRPLPVPGGDAVNCITGVEFLDTFNRGWLFSTAKKIVVVGGGDTSIDVASVARRLGHIGHSHKHDDAAASPGEFGYTAHDVTGALEREGVSAVLTTLFPVEKMTAAEREREDAKREGIEIKGSVMPLEVLKDEQGKAIGLRMCECSMKGNVPIPVEGTEFVLECDMIISAIGQMADLSDGLEKLDSGRSSIAVDGLYKVRNMDKHFAGGDAIRPHLLTTAIGHGRIASETIDHFLHGELEDKRPKVDVHQFNLLEELHTRHLEPSPYDHLQVRGTDHAKFAIHNYEDRGSIADHPAHPVVQGPFRLCRPLDPRRAPRRRRACAGRFRRTHRRLHRGAGADRRQALHVLRHVLRMRQLRDLLSADGGVPRAEERARHRSLCRHRLHEMHRLPHLRGCLPDRIHPDGPWGIACAPCEISSPPPCSSWARRLCRSRARPGPRTAPGARPRRIRRAPRASIASPTRRSCAAITC